MEIDGRIIRQMILYSLIVLIVPMILFPILLGSDIMKSSLMKASFAFAMIEFVFYGFCVYFFNKETNLTKLLLSAALCVVGRYFMGAVLGLLIAAMYAMSVGIALSFGTVSFWPAVVLHILATPFILKPLFVGQKEVNRSEPQPLKETTPERTPMTGTTSFVASAETHQKEQHHVMTDYSDFHAHKSKQKSKQTRLQYEDGFLKAVNYIGENGAVLMAAVVDNEGLLLSSYQRAMYEAENVAPLVLPIIEQNKITLHKMKLNVPEKTDLTFENQRLVIAAEKYYTLVIIAERSMDDVLNIRINQALEMIRIYTAERYSEKLIGNAERIYV